MRRYRAGTNAWQKISSLLADLHQNFRFEFAGIFFALGVFLVFVATVGYVPQAREWARTAAILDYILTALGGWIFWEAIFASLVILIGAFDFYDTLKKTREFEKLINTMSKEVFLKNRKRIKHLAEWDLPSRYGDRVAKKELELKIAR
ncbi:MAG: hypothetical protein A3K65_08090 [Euryarchaeota archaeon RBG_16_68_12]|nr:MAG: hypothetical protein A3K65_08090 [Euryarchaeota archaeon RBG_16_68_12]